MGVKAEAFGGTAEGDSKADSKAERAARRSGAKSSNGSGAKAKAASKPATKTAAKKTAAKKTTTPKAAPKKRATKQETAKKTGATERKPASGGGSGKKYHVLEVFPNPQALIDAGYDGPVIADIGEYKGREPSKAVDALVDDATEAQGGVPRDGDFIPVPSDEFVIEKVRHTRVRA